MTHLALRLAAVLAAEDDTTALYLWRRLRRDTPPRHRSMLIAPRSVLWC